MSNQASSASSIRPLTRGEIALYVLGGVLLVGLFGTLIFWHLNGSLNVSEPFGLPRQVFTVLLGLYTVFFTLRYFRAVQKRQYGWIATSLASAPVLYFVLYLAVVLQDL